jgi:hypothetical protein
LVSSDEGDYDELSVNQEGNESDNHADISHTSYMATSFVKPIGKSRKARIISVSDSNESSNVELCLKSLRNQNRYHGRT